MSSFVEILQHHAHHHSHVIALRTGQLSGDLIEVSYAELFQRIQEISYELNQMHVGRFGLLLDNSLEWILLDLAAMQAGITVIPVPLFFSNEQVSHLIKDADLDALIVASEWDADSENISFGDHGQGLQIESMNTVNVGVIRLSKKNISSYDNHVAKVTYTSGSTGSPKGVCLSLNTLEQVASSLSGAVSSLALETHLCVMPLATLLENIAGVYVPLLKGSTIHIEPLDQLGLTLSSGLNPQRFLSALQLIQPDSIIVLPQLLQLLVGSVSPANSSVDSQVFSLGFLKFVAVGGSKTSPALIQQALALQLPVYEGYGLSECGSVLCLNTPENYRAGSVGKPLQADTVRILDDDEIEVSGQCMLGYLGDSIADTDNTKQQQAINNSVQTGDLGYFDRDGFLYLSGRKKNLIISSFGRNISPEWVESELELSPLITQCMVYGDSRPYLVAIIVPVPLATESQIQQAIEQCNQTLPDYARVKAWFIAENPFSIQNGLLTYNGRPKRNHITAQYQHILEALYGFPQENVA